MQGENGCSGLDESRADVEAVARAVAQAAAHLHRDGHVDGLRDRRDDAAGELGVVEQRRPGARLRHLADGAAEVDVDEVGAGRLDHARRLRHRAGVRAEDLDRERMLVRRDAQVPERLLVAVLDAGARDHLRADEARSEAASLAPKCLHADARHRREHEPRRHLDGVDEPAFPEVDLHGVHGRCMPFAPAAPRQLPFTTVLTPEIGLRPVPQHPGGLF